jgi:hypothetical protein
MSSNHQLARERAEGQYLDLVDFVTQHPNQPVTSHDYLNWEHRNLDVQWDPEASRVITHQAQDRLDQMAVVATLPARPGVGSPSRGTVWLAELLREGGAFYRTGHGKSGAYVLDTAARFRPKGTHGKVELVNHRWPHSPNARVRKVLTRLVEPPTAPLDPTGETLGTLSINGVPMGVAAVKVVNPEVLLDPSPDELRSSAERAQPVVAAPTHAERTATVLAVGETVGDEVVIQVESADGGSALVIARVTSFIPTVR